MPCMAVSIHVRWEHHTNVLNSININTISIIIVIIKGLSLRRACLQPATKTLKPYINMTIATPGPLMAITPSRLVSNCEIAIRYCTCNINVQYQCNINAISHSLAITVHTFTSNNSTHIQYQYINAISISTAITVHCQYSVTKSHPVTSDIPKPQPKPSRNA